ncbi:MAG: cation:proton antiporter [Myxococcota bacterium]
MSPSLFVAVVLVVAGALALELGITSAITEILAGCLLGTLVDVEGLGWLEFLSHFGMLGLMFMAGFEVDVAVLRRQWRASLGIGVASFAVPAVGTFALCSLWLGLAPMAAGLVSIALSTTSLALVYQFLRERGRLSGDIGQTILGAATAVDLLSMIALAALFGDMGLATVIFILGLVPAFWALPRIGRWVFERYRGHAAEFEVRFLLLVLVGLGYLSERVGVHAAIVAFAAGLALSDLLENDELVIEKLKGVVFSFLAPAFFLRAGTLFDPRTIDLSTARVAAVLLVSAVGLKFVGAFLSARVLLRGLGRYVGVLFNYRLTFGIITALVGLQEGVITAELFSVILIVVLGSGLLPMILLRDLPNDLDMGK